MTVSELYNPPAFRVDDPQILGDCIDALRFGTLVTNGANGPGASHLPFLLERDSANGTLCGHLARVNDHARGLDGEPALVIFQGPAHYVSPSWYPSKAETGKVVPTWNYVAVHARGRIRLRDDPAWLESLITRLTDRMEEARPAPWRVSDAPADYIARMLEHIVGVEIPLDCLQGKFKLGQNRPAADRAGLAAGLRTEQPDVWARIRQLPGSPTDL